MNGNVASGVGAGPIIAENLAGLRRGEILAGFKDTNERIAGSRSGEGVNVSRGESHQRIALPERIGVRGGNLYSDDTRRGRCTVATNTMPAKPIWGIRVRHVCSSRLGTANQPNGASDVVWFEGIVKEFGEIQLGPSMAVFGYAGPARTLSNNTLILTIFILYGADFN